MSKRKEGSLTGCRHVRKLFWRLCSRQMRKAEVSFQSVMLNFHSPYVIWYLIGLDHISKQKCKIWSFRYYVALNHADVKFTMKSNSRKEMRGSKWKKFLVIYSICYIRVGIGIYFMKFQSFTSLVRITVVISSSMWLYFLVCF